MVQGHGTRDRDLRGPREPEGKPETTTVAARRFLCILCGAVVMVVPSEVVPGRHYSATAIGIALALFGILKVGAREVRARVCTLGTVGYAAAEGWQTLRRWIHAVRAGVLFPFVREVAPGWPLRRVAERAATTLEAWAPIALAGQPRLVRVVAGAAQAR